MRLAASTLTVVFSVSSAIACGGAQFTGGGAATDASVDGTTGSDGAIDAPEDAPPSDALDEANDAALDGGLVSACPSTPPANNASCAPSGLQCEYGSDPNVGCNIVDECSAQGFEEAQIVTKPRTCPTPTFPQENKCAASYAAVPVGTACADEGLECAYPEGICACVKANVGPIGPTPKWTCPTPGAGCPQARPRIGAACASEGQSCNYGECTYPGGANLKCTQGIWSHASTPCPL